MATIRTGSIVSDIRGSVGSETYSRNPGGLYVKARSTPTQPASSHRDLTQLALTTITQAWSGTLTEAQRAGWRQYAKRWPIPNRLGQMIHVTGLNHFVRCNFYEFLSHTSVRNLNAPPSGPAHIPTFTFTANGTSNQVTIALPMTNYSPPPTEQRLYLFLGEGINSGRTYYSSPWRWSGYNWWSGSYWVNSPWTVSTPWPISAGNKIFAKIVTVLTDAETSGPYPCSTIIT